MAQLQHLSKPPRHPVTKMTSPNDEMESSPSHTRVGTPIDLATSTEETPCQRMDPKSLKVLRVLRVGRAQSEPLRAKQKGKERPKSSSGGVGF
ncbi:hypothetical protein TNIN_372631 [Trichonephila inaurata madagascariensis]|uniref:Uncharacterized protein n=1 Tax=Trichonephila inaurata madagascariensis TaxID=2747483 RepID=A0A8X7CGE1_9ARAC|nr:hypothetical protein TNIN_372631 [Trichonephila inaurata madagascariensis]